VKLKLGRICRNRGGVAAGIGGSYCRNRGGLRFRHTRITAVYDPSKWLNVDVNEEGKIEI